MGDSLEKFCAKINKILETEVKRMKEEIKKTIQSGSFWSYFKCGVVLVCSTIKILGGMLMKIVAYQIFIKTLFIDYICNSPVEFKLTVDIDMDVFGYKIKANFSTQMSLKELIEYLLKELLKLIMDRLSEEENVMSAIEQEYNNIRNGRFENVDPEKMDLAKEIKV